MYISLNEKYDFRDVLLRAMWLVNIGDRSGQASSGNKP